MALSKKGSGEILTFILFSIVIIAVGLTLFLGFFSGYMYHFFPDSNIIYLMVGSMTIIFSIVLIGLIVILK